MAEILLGVKDACCCCLMKSEHLYDVTRGEPSPENMLESCFRIKIVHSPGDIVLVCEVCKNCLKQSWNLLLKVRNTQNTLVNVRNSTDDDARLENIKLELQETSEDTHSIKTELDADRAQSDMVLKELKSDSEDDCPLSKVKLEITEECFDAKYSKKNHCMTESGKVKRKNKRITLSKTNDVRKLFLKSVEKAGDSSLSCAVCREPFGDLDSLEKHLGQHVNAGKLQRKRKLTVGFTDGSAQFSSENALKKWVSRQLNENDLTCKICKQSFIVPRLLSAHISSHFPNYVCQECGKCFAFKSNFTAHMEGHSDSSYACGVCKKTYNRKENLGKHIRTAHMNRSFVYKCPQCPEVFTTHYSKVKHLAEVHDDHSRKHTCTVCSRKFNTAGSLGCHIKRTHLLHKDRSCEVCGALFYGKNTLDNHMLTHTGERNFTCGVCGKSYSRKRTLTEHMRIHNNDKRFQCDVCERRFTQKCTLVGHLKTHDRKRTDGDPK